MKAIVYTSQTGHTQRYAQMLAERTGVPAYSLKEAGKSLRRGEEIFYMGWLMAGTVKGLQSAMDRYTIRGAAIVGVSPQGNGDLWTEARINGGYSDSGGRLFYLQGGYAPEKLGFFYRHDDEAHGRLRCPSGAGPGRGRHGPGAPDGGDLPARRRLCPGGGAG